MDKCTLCHQAIIENCNYNQGRCPHRKPMIDIQPKDTSKGHFYVSLVKSFVRIAAGIALILAGTTLDYVYVMTAGSLLIVAEVLGIAEELV